MRRLRHNLGFLIGQPIQPIHQRVNLPVCGLDLALIELLIGGNGGVGELLVQCQHALGGPDLGGFRNLRGLWFRRRNADLPAATAMGSEHALGFEQVWWLVVGHCGLKATA